MKKSIASDIVSARDDFLEEDKITSMQGASLKRELHLTLTARLEDAANPKTKEWFEKYLRYAVRYRGTPTPKIKKIVQDWRRETGLDQRSAADQLQAIQPLWQGDFAEDKFAAAIYIQLFLTKELPPDDLIDAMERVLVAEWLYDWSTIDWVCVRVFRPTLLQAEALGDKTTAKRILSWKNAAYLWQARCSVVSFAVTHHLTSYHTEVLQACDLLMRREERFAKTAVGWFLRELSRYDANRVRAKLEEYGSLATTEVRRNALKHISK